MEKAISIAVRSLTPNRPYHVQWMLTRKCNFRCRGCNVWQEQDVRELSTEKVKKGLDILRNLGVVELVLSGGNPLLRDDIDEILEYASRLFVTTIYDNGSMATKKIDALRNVDFVAISIDSLDPQKNDYARGTKNALHNALASVEKLHNEEISVGVAPTISQFNLYEILDFTKFFLKKDIPVWYSLYSYDSLEESSLFKIGKKNDEFVIVDKKALIDLCDSLIAIKKGNSNIFMTSKLLKAIKTFYLTGKRTWKCRALRSFFIVDHIGRVAGCHLYRPITSIFDLPRMWSAPNFENLRDTYSKCERCTYLCYMFYSIHGSVLGNLQLAGEQWKNARMLLKRRRLMSLGSVEIQ